MKRKTIISAITLCTCILLTACGERLEQTSVSQTVSDTSTSTDTPSDTDTSVNTEISDPNTSASESRPIIPVEYENNFYTIDTVISEQVDQDEYKRFGEMYRETDDFNIVNFVKHFNYPKELFADIVEQYDLEWYDVDVIYSGDEDRIAKFFHIGDYMANTKYANYVETDLSKYKPTGKLAVVLESGMGSYCGHNQDYHSIPSLAYELVDEEKHKNYIDERGWGVEAFNIVDYVRYMDISKEDYIANINKHFPPDTTDSTLLKLREKDLEMAEIIYCGDDTKINHYFNENDWSYKPAENEKEPTKNFFVTHGALMRYLGVENYHSYLDCVYGTKYDNIQNLIEYFRIDKSTFEEIMKTAEASDFYDIDDLFF